MLFRWATGISLTSWSETESTLAVIIIGMILFAVFGFDKSYLAIIARFDQKGLQVSASVKFISNAYPVLTFIGLVFSAFLSWGIGRS